MAQDSGWEWPARRYLAFYRNRVPHAAATPGLRPEAIEITRAARWEQAISGQRSMTRCAIVSCAPKNNKVKERLPSDGAMLLKKVYRTARGQAVGVWFKGSAPRSATARSRLRVDTPATGTTVASRCTKTKIRRAPGASAEEAFKVV